MELKLPDGFNDSIRNLQNELSRATKPIELPEPDISAIEFREDPVKYIKEMKDEIIELQKIQNDKSWPELHPFKFAWFSAFMGAIAALILQKVAQILHLL